MQGGGHHSGAWKVAYADFPHEQKYDDLYTLNATVTDMAGNETRQSLVFSVNRFGSVYVLGEATQQLIKNYYTNTPQPVSITEINVDNLTSKDVTISHDGDITDLAQGQNYTVSQQGSEATWKSFTYTLNAENFKADGNYSVTVYSRDRATNESDNRSKDKEIDFAVDQTAPGIVVSGLENGGVYKEDGHAITIDTSDNMGVRGMKVYSGEQKIAEYTGDQLQTDYGTETLNIPAQDKVQTITFISDDIAGNETKQAYDNVIVSMNADTVQDAMTPTTKSIFSGKGLAAKAAAGAAAATGVAAVGAGSGLALRRRRIGKINISDKKTK